MPLPQLPPFINLQRLIALAMMFLECVIVLLLARTFVFPGIVLAACIFGVTTHWRVKFDRKLAFNLFVILWLVMLAQYALLPSNPRYNELFAGQQVAYLIAQYLMCVQAAYFFVLRRDNLLPASFVLLGAGALASLAIVQLRRNHEPFILQSLHAIFVVGALLFWSQSRRLVSQQAHWFSGRTLLAGLTALIIVGTGCGAAWAMARYETQLDRWVMSLLDFEKPTTDVGFAETSQIGTVRLNQSLNGDHIALHVSADAEPGYFRGKVYDSYVDREWQLVLHSLPVERLSTIPAELPAKPEDGMVFSIVGAASGHLESMTVRPRPSLSGIFFAPLETAFLQVRHGRVTQDQHSVLRTDERSATTYRLIVAEQHVDSDIGEVLDVGLATAPAGSLQSAVIASSKLAPELDRLLSVPASVRESPKVLALCAEIFRDAKTTRAKIAAVEKYFSNYRYTLTASPPRNRDPIEWFLTEKPDAHCEYFGSGTVMLLRLAGVPSRYVTGFVVDERNSITGEYVARNKDAHAWAEARLDDGHWETIETTPSNGRPTENGPKETANLWEALSALFDRWRQEIAEVGVTNVLRSALVPALKFVAIAAVLGAIALGYQRYRRAKSSQPKPLYQPHALEVELLKYDRMLIGHFRPRASHETLSQYAAALDEAARAPQPTSIEFDLSAAALWYRAYEQKRFAAK